jgi:SlyX protein
MDHLHIETRLTALEIKASFAEDTIDRLDAIIIRQQKHIDLLLQEVLYLRQMGQDAEPRQARNPRDELPPHY